MRKLILVSLVTLSAVGCGSTMPRGTVQDGRTALATMDRTCERASLRERLGLYGVRTAEGTFYCGTGL